MPCPFAVILPKEPLPASLSKRHVARILMSWFRRKNIISSAARTNAILDTVVDGIVTINQQGIVESFNPSAERIFGYKASEVIGQNVKMLMPEPYHAEHDGYLKHYNNTGEKNVIGIGREVQAMRKDGSVFPMELAVSEFYDGKQKMFVGSIRDITEKRQLTANLTGQMAAINKVQAIIEFNLDGVITNANQIFLDIVGYTLEEIQGHHHSMFVDFLENNRDDYHHFWEVLKKGNYQQGEFKRVGKNGKKVWIQGSYNPILDENGKPYKIVKYAIDVTARKTIEQENHHYMLALTRSNKELDDFAYIASHDLKEPLRGLTNNALFIKEDYEDRLDEEGVRRLNRMGYLCQRMERLVDDLLYFSRLGRQELAIQEVNLNEVIHDIASMMEDTLKEKNVKIEIPQPLPTIVCDVPRITEVFRNLITNAVKYNIKPEKRVEIGTAEKIPPGISPTSQRCFYVRDNGIGIAEEFYSDVFRIFKRLNDEDDSMKGTGVGLTFVKKIIERHGGTIWIDSTLGVGTTFYFTLNPQAGDLSHD